MSAYQTNDALKIHQDLCYCYNLALKKYDEHIPQNCKIHNCPLCCSIIRTIKDVRWYLVNFFEDCSELSNF